MSFASQAFGIARKHPYHVAAAAFVAVALVLLAAFVSMIMAIIWGITVGDGTPKGGYVLFYITAVILSSAVAPKEIFEVETAKDAFWVLGGGPVILSIIAGIGHNLIVLLS